jgi:hypothetical protein
MTDDSDQTVNAQLVTEGLARVAKYVSVDALVSGILNAAAPTRLTVASRLMPSGNDSLQTNRLSFSVMSLNSSCAMQLQLQHYLHGKRDDPRLEHDHCRRLFQ